MKRILFKQRSDRSHWVGDGFPVRTVFSYDRHTAELSPFLLMDYAGPTEFPPSAHRRGVGEHPHRGFETVTIVYSGEVEHRDSAGGGGVIASGDVQWMTAAGGLVHEEKHGPNFAAHGGAFELIQLWVNLPAKHKMDPPRYQGLQGGQMPRVELASGAGSVRVVAGEWKGQIGPAKTHTPVNVWDVHVKSGCMATMELPQSHNVIVFVRKGKLLFGDHDALESAELGVFERSNDPLVLSAAKDTDLVVLSGEPIAEPVVGYGPFVMNSAPEIQQALDDYRAGKMGRLA